MFEEDENPGYDALLIDAAAHITKWLHNDWYESSTEEIPQPEEEVAPAQPQPTAG